MIDDPCTVTSSTNDEWKVLQSDLCHIIVELGDEIQGVADHFKNRKACGCASCIEHINLLQKRIGPLCEHAGKLQQELKEVIGGCFDKK